MAIARNYCYCCSVVIIFVISTVQLLHFENTSPRSHKLSHNLYLGENCNVCVLPHGLSFRSGVVENDSNGHILRFLLHEPLLNFIQFVKVTERCFDLHVVLGPRDQHRNRRSLRTVVRSEDEFIFADEFGDTNVNFIRTTRRHCRDVKMQLSSNNFHCFRLDRAQALDILRLANGLVHLRMSVAVLVMIRWWVEMP